MSVPLYAIPISSLKKTFSKRAAPLTSNISEGFSVPTPNLLLVLSQYRFESLDRLVAPFQKATLVDVPEPETAPMSLLNCAGVLVTIVLVVVAGSATKTGI